MTTLPTDPDAFRAALAREMELDGRSQAALAKRLGVHQSAISRILSGDRRVRVEEAAIIAEYLSETAADTPYLIKLTDEEGPEDDIGTYPDVLEVIQSTIASDKGLSTIDVMGVENDYEFVIRICASLSVALQTCVITTANTSQDEELRTLAKAVWRYDTAKKIAALVRVRRIWKSEGERMSSIFAIRDALVHSPARLSLVDPRLSMRLKSVIDLPAGTEPTPPVVKALFGLATAVLLMRLGEPDPAVTAQVLRETADDVLHDRM